MSPPRPPAVFITGASRGLGRELAREYAPEGKRTGSWARAADALEELADELVQRHGVRCLALAADVRDPASMRSAAGDFMDEFGDPDRVIANEGTHRHADRVCGGLRRLSAGSRDQRARHGGHLRTFRAVYEGERAGHAGRRGLGRGRARTARRAGAYSASKAAAIRYLESLRVELRPARVRVVTLCPGYVDTDMTAGNPYPMPFLLRADEAARRLVRAIERGARHAVIPWPMALDGTRVGAAAERGSTIVCSSMPGASRADGRCESRLARGTGGLA